MKTLGIRFEEAPDDEYVVRISPVPTSDLLAIIDLLAKLNLTRESVDALADAFRPYVVSGADDLLALDFNVFYGIVNGWVSGVRDAPLPLPLRSSDGGPSPEPQA